MDETAAPPSTRPWVPMLVCLGLSPLLLSPSACFNYGPAAVSGKVIYTVQAKAPGATLAPVRVAAEMMDGSACAATDVQAQVGSESKYGTLFADPTGRLVAAVANQPGVVFPLGTYVQRGVFLDVTLAAGASVSTVLRQQANTWSGPSRCAATLTLAAWPAPLPDPDASPPVPSSPAASSPASPVGK